MFSLMMVDKMAKTSHLGKNPKISLCTGGAYYVPYSCLLISNKFCNGGERPEQGDQVTLCTCSSPPPHMGPETFLVGYCA
jgi:hypothetical protein